MIKPMSGLAKVAVWWPRGLLAVLLYSFLLLGKTTPRFVSLCTILSFYAFFFSFSETGSHCVPQPGVQRCDDLAHHSLDLLGSSDPPDSIPPVAEITAPPHPNNSLHFLWR